MLRSCLLVIALSLPAATLYAQTAPVPPSRPNPPMRMQVPPGAPGALGGAPARPTPFDEMDTNHDGVVTRDEYIAYQKKRFDEFDMNHDGKVDAKEIASSPPLMERNLKTAERMVKEWDKNGDGVVSADEYQAAAAERFAHQDKDGTGIKRPAQPGMPAKGQILPNGQPMQAPVQPQPQPKKP